MNETITNEQTTEPLPRRDHKYDSWSVISFAHSAELYRGDVKLSRAEYPDGFRRYLPDDIGPEDPQYKVAKFPGMAGDFKECVKMYLGPAWDSGIADDLQSRSLVGNDQEICDNRRTESGVQGWNLVEVCVHRLEDETRVAKLNFEKEGGGDKVRAEWSWRGVP